MEQQSKLVNNKDEKIESTLNELVEFFKTADNIPYEVAKQYLEGLGKPSDSWSLNNKMIQRISGNTNDARTYKQWAAAGRQVQYGQKAFYILGPNNYIVEKKNEKTGEIEKVPILRGFHGIAVFADHQTKGKKIEYVKTPKQMPPLFEVAKKLGIDVTYSLAGKGNYWGRYSYDEFSDYQSIKLCTADQGTFFHELAHAVHRKIDGKLKNGQDPEQEIIAEFTSCVIAAIYGINKKNYSFHYIKGYSDNDRHKMGENIIKVLSKVQKILDFIFNLT